MLLNVCQFCSLLFCCDICNADKKPQHIHAAKSAEDWTAVFFIQREQLMPAAGFPDSEMGLFISAGCVMMKCLADHMILKMSVLHRRYLCNGIIAPSAAIPRFMPVIHDAAADIGTSSILVYDTAGSGMEQFVSKLHDDPVLRQLPAGRKF